MGPGHLGGCPRPCWAVPMGRESAGPCAVQGEQGGRWQKVLAPAQPPHRSDPGVSGEGSLSRGRVREGGSAPTGPAPPRKTLKESVEVPSVEKGLVPMKHEATGSAGGQALSRLHPRGWPRT